MEAHGGLDFLVCPIGFSHLDLIIQPLDGSTRRNTYSSYRHWNNKARHTDLLDRPQVWLGCKGSLGEG